MCLTFFLTVVANYGYHILILGSKDVLSRTPNQSFANIVTVEHGILQTSGITTNKWHNT
jgi:hypothetical protein